MHEKIIYTYVGRGLGGLGRGRDGVRWVGWVGLGRVWVGVWVGGMGAGEDGYYTPKACVPFSY